MRDDRKTKAVLIEELVELRREVERLKAGEHQYQQQTTALSAEEGHLLRTLMDSLPDYIYAKDRQGRFLLSNMAHNHLLNAKTSQELLNKSDFDFYPKERAQQFYTGELAIMESGQPLVNHVAASIDRNTGEQTWLSTTKIPFKDDSGDILGLVGVGRDITEQMRAEERLRQSEARIRSILEIAPIPMFISRLSDGVVTYANKYIGEIIGISPEELLGQATPDYYQDLADRKKLLDEVRQHGHAENYELALKRPDGTPFWASVSIRVMEFDGVPSLFVGLIDTTQRKYAEAALEKHALELESVAQVATIASTILSPQKLLQEVANLTKEQFNLYHAHIYLLNDMGDTLNLVAGAGDVGEKLVAQKWNIPLEQEQSLVARAARTGAGVIVDNVREDPEWLPNPLLPDTYSELAVPMTVADRVLGVLDVQSNEIARFTNKDVNIQSTLASQVAVALENARLFEQGRQTIAQTERQAWRLALMNEIAANLSQSADIDEVFRIVGSKTDEIVESDRVSVALLTPQGDKFEIMELSETQGAVPIEAVLPLEGTLVGRAVREMDVVVNSETRDSQYIDVKQMYKAGLRSSLAAPLIASGRVLGTLNVASTKPNAYNVSDKNLMGQIASLLASTMESRQLFDQVQVALAEQQKSSNLLQERVKELNCLNDIGREIAETPPLSEFLPWLAARIPAAMQKPDLCSVAINYDNRLYGVAEAVDMPARIVNALRASGEVVGRITIAYSEKRDFIDEESALLGGIANRTSSYVESRRLFNQIQNRAERERLVNAISQKIQSTITVDSALQTAIQELGQAFQARRTQVKLAAAGELNRKKTDSNGANGT